MKKNILIFGLTSNFGGIEKITYDLLSLLNHSDYKLIFVNSSDSIIRLDNKISRFDTEVVSFNSKRKGRYTEFKKQLYDLLKMTKPHAVLEVFGDSTYFEPLAVAKKIGINKRIAFATMGKINEHMDLRYKIINAYSKQKIKNSANCLLSVSKDTSFYTFGQTKKEIIYISGIDSTHFKFDNEVRKELRKQYGLGDNTKVFSEIGRICPDKNQLYSLELFAKYHKEHNDSHLFFIGNYEDAYYHFLQSKISELGILQNVRFIESQPEVSNYYSFSDVILFPSLREGFGLVAVEAQANGVPCIAFKEVINPSLQITDNLILVSKYDSTQDVYKIIKDLNPNTEERKREYIKIKESGLDLANSANAIKELFR